MSSAPVRGPRIAFITTVPLSAHFLRGHLQHLTQQGFEMHFISSPGPQLEELERDGITTHCLPMSRSISPLADFFTLIKLVVLLLRIRPQIIHAYTPKAVLLGATAGRLARVPHVAVSLFGLRQMDMGGRMRKLLDATTRFSCWLADWVWCDSRSLGDYIVKENLCRESKLSVLGTGSVGGVDAAGVFSPEKYPLAERQALRDQYGIPAEATIIGFVGRIVRDKGVGELLAAWRVLREQHPHLRLLLVGPQEDTDPIAAADRELIATDPRIHAVGLQRNVALHLALMDVYVNASYREGFCMANAEAAAMEVAVVTTRIPGNVDTVIEGTTGSLAPVKDAAALVELIDRYLVDPQLRRQHGQAARAWMLRDFCPPDYRAALEAQYWQLLAGKRQDAVATALES